MNADKQSVSTLVYRIFLQKAVNFYRNTTPFYILMPILLVQKFYFRANVIT